MVKLRQNQLTSWCEDLLSGFVDRQILLLQGPLGAGKSQLVKQFVEILSGGQAHSPTFSLINDYSTESFNIFHIDLYRIEDQEDLESTGFWDLFEVEKGLIFIEWPERMDVRQLPNNWSCCTIRISQPTDDRWREYQLVD